MRRILRSVTTRLTISICAIALAAGAARLTAQAWGTMGQPIAKKAKTVYLVENARLRFDTKDEKGSSLVEHGQATGTYNAPVTALLTIHPKSVTATVTIFPRGGSITGTAHANYVVKNSYAYFGGTFTLDRGTGKYRHVSEVNGKPLGISGTIERYSFAMEVKAHGEANL